MHFRLLVMQHITEGRLSKDLLLPRGTWRGMNDQWVGLRLLDARRGGSAACG